MKRIEWIDDLKGFAIFLIVLGHVLATFANMSQGNSKQISDTVFEFIYSFHVPLFFIIAGITFSAKDQFTLFFKKKFYRLMLPYYSWGFFSAILYAIVGQFIVSEISSVATSDKFAQKAFCSSWYVPILSIVHAGTWPDGKGFCFNGVLWFLPVLFCCELLYYWIARLIRYNDWDVAVVGVLFCILLWASPLINIIIPFNLPQLIRYMPFIAFGHLLSGYLFNEHALSTKPRERLLLPYVAALPFLLYFILSGFLPIARDNASYWIEWVMTALGLCLFVIWLAKVHAFRSFSFFAQWTIGIMLFHKFPLVAIQVLLGRYCRFLLGNTILVLLLDFFVTLLLMYLCMRFSKLVRRFIPWSLGFSNP